MAIPGAVNIKGLPASGGAEGEQGSAFQAAGLSAGLRFEDRFALGLRQKE